jgi:hypothetical protein
VTLDKDIMEDVRASAAKERSVGPVVQESFRVLAVVSRNPNFTMYVMQRVSDNSEVTILVSHEDVAPDVMQKLWETARTRKPITLELNLTINKGAVRSALFVSVAETSS